MIITGQGDNQVVKLFLPKIDADMSNDRYILQDEDYIREQILTFMATLTRTAEEIGLPIKREETWISTNVFVYGKEIIVKGTFLPGALKRIGRVYFEVNEVFPTCESKLATIHTSGQAATQKGDHPIFAYAISVMESYFSFLKDLRVASNWSPPLKNHLKNKNPDHIIEILRFCSLLFANFATQQANFFLP